MDLPITNYYDPDGIIPFWTTYFDATHSSRRCSLTIRDKRGIYSLWTYCRVKIGSDVAFSWW